MLLQKITKSLGMLALAILALSILTFASCSEAPQVVEKKKAPVGAATVDCFDSASCLDTLKSKKPKAPEQAK